MITVDKSNRLLDSDMMMMTMMTMTTTITTEQRHENLTETTTTKNVDYCDNGDDSGDDYDNSSSSSSSSDLENVNNNSAINSDNDTNDGEEEEEEEEEEIDSGEDMSHDDDQFSSLDTSATATTISTTGNTNCKTLKQQQQFLLSSLLLNNNNGGGEHFFEGAEKRLCIRFSTTDKNNNNQSLQLSQLINIATTDEGYQTITSSGMATTVANDHCHDHDGGVIKDHHRKPKLDLRSISSQTWKRILNLVNCQVLNIITNQHIDAYLLSESSMFVTNDQVIIKTCGSTTLLNCVEELLTLIAEQTDFTTIEDLSYSHKNLLLPSLQHYPHDSFRTESEYLNQIFNAGKSHLFGHLNSDRFYSYTIENDDDINEDSDEDSDDSLMRLFKFEIIMEQLDQDVMQLFVQQQPSHHQRQHQPPYTASMVTKKSGIDTLIPGMMIDDHLFEPCGYSMNGILGQHYMTIHITPEQAFSYVSLEMNVPQRSYVEFIQKVLFRFKPGKFMINIVLPTGGGGGGGGCGDNEQKKKKKKKKDENVYNPKNIDDPETYADPDSDSDSDSFDDPVSLLYEELNTGDKKRQFEKFARTDLQMAQYKHFAIIYARYVAEGFS